MTARLNDREWEMLSAFMDGQLSLSEKSHIEQRLQSDPEWAAAYLSLVRTRSILREIPRVKRRRNYFLTQEMVRKSGWLRIVPTLNFSSAAAAIFAILLFIMDIFPQASGLNRASAPLAAAPMSQDSAARPAAETNVPGKPEFNLTGAPAVSTEKEQVGGVTQNQTSPQATPLPEAGILSTTPAEEAAAAQAAAAPAPESPQILSELPQTGEGPVGLTAPSMKAAPPAAMAVPSAAQNDQAPEVFSMPAQSQTNEATNLPETLQMDKAGVHTVGPAVEPQIEPTNLPIENSAVPSPTKISPEKTSPPPALSEQKSTEIPTKIMAATKAVPVAGAGRSIVSPTPTSIRPVERVEPLPISRANLLIKIGWITLLAISGILALLSAILKKKSLS